MTAIYQIQYGDNVIGKFDSEFICYDCREFPESEKREIAHMQRFFHQGIWRRSDVSHFGLVSPKFNIKTGLTGFDFKNWIKLNPGYDVYFINPFPQLQYFHFNVWEQGEYWHPGLKELADLLFESANLNLKVEGLPRNSRNTLLYSNYWVGNELFWRKFIAFVDKLTSAIEALKHEEKNRFFIRAPHYASATYFPFVFERIFSTYINFDKTVRCLAYPYSQDEILRRCVNDFERLIVSGWADIIDLRDAKNPNDPELRVLFKNIEDLQRLFNGQISTGLMPKEIKSPVTRLLDRFLPHGNSR